MTGERSFLTNECQTLEGVDHSRNRQSKAHSFCFSRKSKPTSVAWESKRQKLHTFWQEMLCVKVKETLGCHTGGPNSVHCTLQRWAVTPLKALWTSNGRFVVKSSQSSFLDTALRLTIRAASPTCEVRFPRVQSHCGRDRSILFCVELRHRSDLIVSK